METTAYILAAVIGLLIGVISILWSQNKMLKDQKCKACEFLAKLERVNCSTHSREE